MISKYMFKCPVCKVRYSAEKETYLCKHCYKKAIREQQEISRETQELRAEEEVYDKQYVR